MENMRGDQVSAVDRFSGPTGLRELAAWMRACLHVDAQGRLYRSSRVYLIRLKGAHGRR